MKRIYRNKPTIDVDYFVGNEVEKTPFYGRKTLFVVGFKNPRKIVKKATDHHCRHIYLGANMSFKNVEWNDNRTAKLRDIITHLLDNQFQVTLDISKTFDLTTIDMFIDSEYFHIMYSLPIAYAEKYKNTMTIKVDDVGFNKTNTGVWCNPLSKLMDPITKTEWSSYQTDEVIEE
jgi:hypothetical protein|tara:strand:+ start:615 stop:1139 length:525 start_codon:yes stop_codon:yes gene_type:complete